MRGRAAGRSGQTFLTWREPEDAATTDLTPRRCQKFKAAPGDGFRWTRTAVEGGAIEQSGTVVADRDGLVTVPGLALSKAKRRVAIERQ
ncbi:MAG: hypothetical protein IMZ55_13380 [Acidobacteria bacterium]|nr:hypothetical protein [Acidobacteriota bacterium]